MRYQTEGFFNRMVADEVGIETLKRTLIRELIDKIDIKELEKLFRITVHTEESIKENYFSSYDESYLYLLKRLSESGMLKIEVKIEI